MGLAPSSSTHERAAQSFGEIKMTQTTSITVHAHGKTFDLALDNKYASASQMIPLITRLFSKEPNTVVTSRSLHARLGKTYKHNSWLERVKKDCRLTLNEDYWEEEADPNSIEDRRLLAQNAGKPLTLTYFSLKAARKITLLSGSDEGHAFYEFVDAVLEAITPKLLDEIREMNILIAHQRNIVDRNEALTLQAVKQAGAPSISAFEQASIKDGLLRRARAESALHEAAALLFWEMASKARRATNPKARQEALDYLYQKYGNYSDLSRDSPPWMSE
jgi:hypothetical protein